MAKARWEDAPLPVPRLNQLGSVVLAHRAFVSIMAAVRLWAAWGVRAGREDLTWGHITTRKGRMEQP